jgi:hypothetical protein
MTLSNPLVGLGGTNPEPTVGSTATFTNLNVNASGYGYQLTAAFSPNPDSIPSATSTRFDAHNDVSLVQCSGSSCSGNTTDPAGQDQLSASSQTAGNGQLFLALDPAGSFWAAQAGACGNYKFLSADQDTINLTTTGAAKILADTLTNVPIPAGTSVFSMIQGQQFCLAAQVPFIGDDGTPATGPVTLPDGSSGFVGLLEECPSFVHDPAFTLPPGNPCVSGRSGSQSGSTATLTIDVTFPSTFAGDPIGHH